MTTNNNYFPDNLPAKAPRYLIPEKRVQFQQTLDSIHARMQLLNEACNISSVDAPAFASIAKDLFNRSPEHFDQMDTFELANIVGDLDDGTVYQDRIWFPNAIPLFDTAFVTKKEWESLRCIGIGGSEAAIIDGTSHFATQYELYNRKRGIEPTVNNEGAQAIFDRGHILEDRIVELFCKTTRAKLLNNTIMWASKKYPHCTANIDAVVKMLDGSLCIFEAKTTDRNNYFNWVNEKIPPYYIGQTRQYPAVLDDDRIKGTYIGCLFTVDFKVDNLYLGSAFDGDQFVSRFVERNEYLEEEQLTEEHNWFEYYVVGGVEPPKVGAPSAELEAVKKYLPEPDNSKGPVTWEYEDYEDALKAYFALVDDIAAKNLALNMLKAKKEDIIAPLIQSLGEHTEARIHLTDQESIVVRYKTKKKSSINKEKLHDIIDSLSGYGVPQEVLEDMRSCFIVDPQGSRTFEIKKEIAVGRSTYKN